MANIWRNRLPHKSGHFIAESFQRVFFLFFSFLLFFSFFHQDLPFLFAAPLCAPHPPSCPHYRELEPGHWPWTLTLPVISHIPGPFPPLRPQTAHRSSPPLSPPLPPVLSLSPCFFPSPSCSIQNGHAGCWRGAAQRQRRVNTASAAKQQSQSPPVSHSYGPRPYLSICEMTLNWWVNDGVNLSGQDSLAFELM